MNESNHREKAASRELAALTARVAKLENIVATLTGEKKASDKPIDFSDIGGKVVFLRSKAAEPSVTREPFDFSDLGGKRVL